jgi:hypothetical protein
MKRSFLFGVGWMLIVTAVLGWLASWSPDNTVPISLTVIALVTRAAAGVVVLALASYAPPAKRRWPAVGMWLLGFIIGFPLGNLVGSGAALAVSAVLR